MTAIAQEPTRPRKERIPELDILRSLAFLAVVLQHAVGVYVRRPGISPASATMLGMIFNFAKFGVPTFVFVTGVGLFYNHYENVRYLRFMRKRLTEIFVPYLVWTLVYQVYYGTLSFTPAGLKEFGRHLLAGNGAYHLWFVAMIFQFYLCYPLLLAVFKAVSCRIKTPWGFWLALGVLTALYTGLMWTSAAYIAGGHLKSKSTLIQLLFVKYRDRNFIFFFYYFFLGGIVGIWLGKWRKFVLRSLTWNGLLFPLLFIWIGYELMTGAADGVVNLSYSTSLKPSMFLYTVSELLLVYGLAMALTQTIIRPDGTERHCPVSTVLKFTGKYSFGAYLMHAMALNYVVQGLNAAVPHNRGLAAGILAFVLCSALSVGFTWALSHLPGKKMLIGP